MKLIIDIDEDYYKAILENGYIYDEDNEDIAKIIKDGTPLKNATNGEIFNKMFDSTFMFVNIYANDKMRVWWNTPYKENSNERNSN